MVEPHRVEARERLLEATAPPRVPVALHARPSIERVAPALAGGAEVVGGHACDGVRHAVGIEIEQLAVLPHVGAVVGHEDGEVADEPDAARVHVASKGGPLPIEQPLQPRLEADLVSMLAARPRERVGAPEADTLFPAGPLHVVVRPLQGGIERPVREPTRFALDERVERRVVRRAGEGRTQRALTEPRRRRIVDRARGEGAHLGGEAPEIREQRVQRERAETAVGRVPVPRRPHRQHLPPPLPRTREEPGEFSGGRSQIATAVGSWQAGEVKQHPRRTFAQRRRRDVRAKHERDPASRAPRVQSPTATAAWLGIEGLTIA